MLVCPSCKYTVLCCNSICPRCGSKLEPAKPNNKGEKK